MSNSQSQLNGPGGGVSRLPKNNDPQKSIGNFECLNPETSVDRRSTPQDLPDGVKVRFRQRPRRRAPDRQRGLQLVVEIQREPWRHSYERVDSADVSHGARQTDTMPPLSAENLNLRMPRANDQQIPSRRDSSGRWNLRSDQYAQARVHSNHLKLRSTDWRIMTWRNMYPNRKPKFPVLNSGIPAWIYGSTGLVNVEDVYKPGGPGYLGYQPFQSSLNPIDEDHLPLGKKFGSKNLSAAAKGFMTAKSKIITADMLTVQEVRQTEPGARYCNASTVQTFINKVQSSVLDLNSQLAKQSRIAKQNEQSVSNREMVIVDCQTKVLQLQAENARLKSQLAAYQTAQRPLEALIKKYTRPDGLALQAVNTVEECLGLIANASDTDVLEALLMTISEQLRILINDIPQQRLDKAFVIGEMAEWFENDRKYIHSVIEEDLFQQAKLAADTTADERGFRRGLAAGQAVHSDNPVTHLPRHVESYIEACAYDINEKWKHEHMRIAREAEKASWEAGFAAGKATYLEQVRSFGYVEAIADQHGPWNAAHARVAGAVLATTYDLDVDKSLYTSAIRLVNAVADGSEDSHFAKALAEAANGPPINLGYPYFHPQPITIPQGFNLDIERYWKEITEVRRHRGERREEQQATAVDDTDTSADASQPTVPEATHDDDSGDLPLDEADCSVPIPEMDQPDHDDFGQTSPTGGTDTTEPDSTAPDPFTWRTNPHFPPPSDTMYGLHGASGFSRRHKPK